MKRILIIGSSGAGKSTLARKMAQARGLHFVSLDHLFWLPGWVERDKNAFDALLDVELKKDAWVMEGNYNRTIPKRLQYADTVILLDTNRFLCAFRAIKRWLRQEGVQAKGCPQKVDLEFLKYILWDYPRRHRPVTKAMMKNPQYAHINWIVLKNAQDSVSFYEEAQNK
ncbi:MAG: AAA family ATPase [Alphaproteobacteria bacterium]|nr:AAA family ATPase [Alphaproteobacteria bacterium]